MKVSEIIQSATTLADKYCTRTVVEKLQSLAQSMAQDSLKVVVLGDFKAGKSTLLNRLFLRRELLPTDYQEATAVPTYISNGSSSLRTWKRDENGAAILVDEKLSFTDSDIASAVTAANEEQRAEKAKLYSHVGITIPDILPNGITVVDTPGLNTTNSAIYTGTLIESRLADAILYVVRAKQLSVKEENLIVDLAGSHKHKVPVHVVLTHDAAAVIDSSQLDNIANTIKAQLKLRGVDCGVSVFSLDKPEAPAAPITEKIGGFDDWSTLWFDEPEPVQEPVADDTNHCVEQELLHFFNGEVQRGRSARVARELMPLLSTIRTAVESRLALSGAKEAEIEQIENSKNEVHKEYLRLVAALLQDVKSLQQQFTANIEFDLDAVRDAHVNELNSLNKAGDILALIKTWPQTMPDALQCALVSRKTELLGDLKVLSIKYQKDLSGELALDTINSQMPEDGGMSKMLKMTPVWLLQVSDYIIFDIISPLPLWMDIFVRMFAEKIPVIGKLLPANIAANMARKMAITKLDESILSIKEQVRDSLYQKFESFNERLNIALSDVDIFAEQEAAIAAARAGVLSSAGKAELERDLELIAQWGNEI